MKALLSLLLLLQTTKLPEGRGKREVVKACGSCHSPEVVLNNYNSRSGWTNLVDEMIEKGAPANARERKEIIGYLARHFPLRPD